MIKSLRISAGLTQRELAEKSGVNLRTLQDYEQGHKDIGGAAGRTLLNLAEALHCTIEELLK